MYALLLTESPPPPPENPGWMLDEQALHEKSGHRAGCAPPADQETYGVLPQGTRSMVDLSSDYPPPTDETPKAVPQETYGVLAHGRNWMVDCAGRCLARLPMFHASYRADH